MKSILKSVTVFMSILIMSINCGNSATTSATSAGTTTTTTNIDCVSQPYNSSLTVSSSTSVSHKAGYECLTGCHNPGASGTTTVRWNVAGTMYTSTLGPVVVSNTPKTTGTITIGGVAIPVDKCGNFYYFNNATAPTGIASTSTAGVAAMTTAIGASNSNCNAGNACHSAFNGTNNGAAGTRIY